MEQDEEEVEEKEEEEETPSEFSFFISNIILFIFIQNQEPMKVVVMYVNIVHYLFVTSHLILLKMI
jgi:hypothetical protein